MTPQTRTSLKELQQLDQEIATVRSATQSFEPLLEEVDAPVLRLEQEVQALEKRLKEIRLEENRIELTIEERRVRAAKLDERMEAVRNVREEAAVHAELEMVRRALESEEQEALSLLDQIKRLEERLEEQEEAYREALAEVEPRRNELVEEQRSTESKLEGLLAEREAFAAGVDPGERRIYDSIMAGARDVAVAELTQDGACGNCYNMVPLQIQNLIRHGDGMIRCEGCGVILTPESPEGLARAQEEGERIERALKASTDQRDAERVALSEAEALGGVEEAATEDVASDDVPAGELAVEDVASDDVSAEEQTVEGGASDRCPCRGAGGRGCSPLTMSLPRSWRSRMSPLTMSLPRSRRSRMSPLTMSLPGSWRSRMSPLPMVSAEEQTVEGARLRRCLCRGAGGRGCRL